MSGEIKSAHPRDLRYLTFVMGRLKGLSDKDIAEKLKCGSIAHLYHRLSDDGYPVCSACGAAPIDKEQHTCGTKRKPGPGTGDNTDLPAASRASKLFEDTLHGLLASAAGLDHRHESSQDGRIVRRDVVEGSSLYLSRRHEYKGRVVEHFSEDRWNELCAEHGEDPDVEGFWVDIGGLRRAAGATRHPAEPLTTLIGAYALAGGDMEELLGRLYPGAPTQEIREAIRKRVEGKKKIDKMDGLKMLARQLVTLVWGQALVGAPPSGLTAMEHDAACYITMLRNEKRSDEEILSRLANHRSADGSELSMTGLHRLGNLRLRYEAD